MQFYIDSADADEIQQAHRRGWVDGVTTNPSLVAKVAMAAGVKIATPETKAPKNTTSNNKAPAGKFPNNKIADSKMSDNRAADSASTGQQKKLPGYQGAMKEFHDQLIKKICQLVHPGLVSAEVLSLEADNMVQEGRALHQLADNVVVKIPMTEQGLIAVRELTQLGIKTNVTLVFSVVQAVLAAKAGATLVSPFVGRIDDTGADGMQLIEHIIKCYNHYKWPTKVLVASVRSPLHVARAAVMGADIMTLPFKVMQSLTQHPLTDKGLAIFLKDAGA